MGNKICSNCGYLGSAKAQSGCLLEAILYVVFIILLFVNFIVAAIFFIPCFLMSMWRLSNSGNQCPSCKTQSMISTTTPRGQELMQKYHNQN